ncbi:MAG: 16S rRNA (cytosine(967)-C(5))-methyltransferase RsmB [Pseudomonadota bacterium]
MNTHAPDPVRQHACLALDAVLREGRSLESALPDGELAGAARRRCRALVYAGCRWQPRLDAVIRRLLSRPLRRRDRRVGSVVLLALTELEYVDGAPHAVVDDAVRLTGALGHAPLRGLVNAVLRRFLRERVSLLAAVDSDPAAAAAHPAWLYATLERDWPASVHAIAEANNARAPMTLRVAATDDRDAYRARLAAQGLVATPGPGASDLVLASPVDVAELPYFEHGACSVQDSAAQFAAQLLAPRAGERVLDACAAPGGKTGHLLELGGEALALTALDASSARLARVSDTVRRLGCEGVTVQAADASEPAQWWDGVPFDGVLLDAPCSGLGVVRRHPDIKVLRRPTDIEALAAVQARLLDALWPLLKPGGRLLYATCSTVRRENDEQVERFLDRTVDAVPATLELPVGRVSGPGWQIFPGEMGCDGFYYALMHRSPVQTAHHD